MSPQIAADLMLLNLPKYVDKSDLKKKYHTLAKQFHPDSQASVLISEAHKERLQEKFNQLNQAYNRLLVWVEERDKQLDQQLQDGTHVSGFRQTSNTEVTYKIGKISLSTHRKDLDRQKLLEQMIEDEVVMGEPYNFVKWMVRGWVVFGVWYLWDDWNYYKKYTLEM